MYYTYRKLLAILLGEMRESNPGLQDHNVRKVEHHQ
jgi:hypothetical protein